jgi:Tol biopolymer transport system component
MRKMTSVFVASMVVAMLGAASPAVGAEADPPEVAPGEPWIVYQAWDGAPHIRLVRPDGSGDHLLVDGTHPDWSPDGSRIAYVVDDVAIWVVNADGGDPEQLPVPCDDTCLLNDSPAWSPDGSTIAVSRFVAPSDGDVYIDVAALDLASGDIRTLYTPPAGEASWYVRWSPDGRSIVVNSDQFPSIDSDLVSGGMIAVVDLAEPDPVARPLTDYAMFATYPDWSPDGSSIVFTTHDLGVRDYGNQQDPSLPSDLYTIRPDGTGLVRLTENPTGPTLIRNGTASGPLSSQPSWTPDGRILFVQVDGEAWPGWQMATIEPDGSDLGPALESGWQQGTHPRMRPTQ